MLDCEPDIACFAKLMTGGIIPLAATLASEATFQAFIGDSKVTRHLTEKCSCKSFEFFFTYKIYSY